MMRQLFRFWWLLLLALLAGCQRETRPLPTGPGDERGFEIRYNATLALMRQGSDRIKDPERLKVLVKMLDEDLQLRNPWRRISDDGQELPPDKALPDPVAARTTVESALKALVELHKQRPDLDLLKLEPEIGRAIDKLTQSSNPALRNEAQRTRIALRP